MNNFNALNNYIASVTQAVNAMAKTNNEFQARLRALESAASAAAPAQLDVDRIVSEAVGKIDVQKAVGEAIERLEIQKLVEAAVKRVDLDAAVAAAVSKLDVPRMVEGEVAKIVDGALKTASAIATSEEQIVIPELGGDAKSIFHPDAGVDDDIIISMKEEKKAPAARKRPSGKKA